MKVSYYHLCYYQHTFAHFLSSLILENNKNRKNYEDDNNNDGNAVGSYGGGLVVDMVFGFPGTYLPTYTHSAAATNQKTRKPARQQLN